MSRVKLMVNTFVATFVVDSECATVDVFRGCVTLASGTGVSGDISVRYGVWRVIL